MCAAHLQKKKKTPSITGSQLLAQVERVGKAMKRQERGGIVKTKLLLMQRGERYWPSGRYGGAAMTFLGQLGEIWMSIRCYPLLLGKN